MDQQDRDQERNNAIEENMRRRELSGDDTNTKKVTKSYKVSPELREKLERMYAQSGIKVQDEWLEKVISDYEMRELANGNNDYTYLLDRLDYFIGGISNVFLTFLNTEKATKMELLDKHSLDATQLQEELENVRADLKKQLEENKEMSVYVEKVRKESETKDATIGQLSGLVEKSDLLSKEYLEKNQTLSDLVAKQTKAAEEGDHFAKEAREAKTEVERLDAELRDIELSIKRMEEEHKQALAITLDRKELEHEREMVRLKSEYNDNLEAVRLELSNRLMVALKTGQFED